MPTSGKIKCPGNQNFKIKSFWGRSVEVVEDMSVLP
jgi:hypothetical protein